MNCVECETLQLDTERSKYGNETNTGYKETPATQKSIGGCIAPNSFCGVVCPGLKCCPGTTCKGGRIPKCVPDSPIEGVNMGEQKSGSMELGRPRYIYLNKGTPGSKSASSEENRGQRPFRSSDLNLD